MTDLAESGGAWSRVPGPAPVLSVLVVDDERAVAHQLADGLATCGFEVCAAHSAAEAATLVAGNAGIGVVVTDIRMPGGDGLGLAERIRQTSPEEAAVEVVMMTGHATVEDAALACRTRVSDFLRKPFRLAEAVQAVSVAMRRARDRRDDVARRLREQARLDTLEDERIRLQGRLDEARRRLDSLTSGKAGGGLERDTHAILHALRAPLDLICGGTDLLVRGGAGEAGERSLGPLNEGIGLALQAVELVEELHLLRLRGSDEVHAPVLLRELLRDAVLALSRESPGDGIRLALPVDLPPLVVRGGRAALRRCVMLCAESALASAPAASVLTASLEPVTAEGADWAVLTFSAAPGAGLLALPPGHVFGEAGSAGGQTQEGLRLLVARQLAELNCGRLTTWTQGAGCMAMRLALPM